MVTCIAIVNVVTGRTTVYTSGQVAVLAVSMIIPSIQIDHFHSSLFHSLLVNPQISLFRTM